MSVDPSHSPIEEQIAQWRGYLRRRHAIDAPDVDELESHLRDQLAALIDAGLTADEAFLVAVKRMGAQDELSREFAREHSERLWKQLVIAPVASDESAVADSRRETLVVLGLAIAAAAAIKIPALFGLRLIPDGDPFYARNAGLFVLPFLTAYFVWKRKPSPARIRWLAFAFVAGAIFANAFPFAAGSHTSILSALHLPIALWLAVGVAYAGDRRFTGRARMDFVRFSGELAVYYVLMALGGAVLTGFTIAMFNAIKMDAQWLAQGWLMPCGAMGAVIVGSWLVEAKQSVIENMAPVLTKIFTPLFTLVLLVFLITMAWTGSPINVEREILIRFDLLLALVVGLVLYAASAREPEAPPGLFDALQFVLVLSALIVDGVALAAIAARISEFGFTPNRSAALGENLILLVNLAWSGWLYARLLRGRGSFAALERWQITYLPVYSVWAALVVAVFPPVFKYL